MSHLFKTADQIEAAGKACGDFLSRLEKAKLLGGMNESEVVIHAFKSGFYRGIEFKRQEKGA